MNAPRTFVVKSRSFLLRMKIVSAKVVKKIKTNILCSVFFFFENRAVYDIMWGKYCRVGQATDDNMAYAHCMLDTDYKYTLRICNAYSSSASVSRYTYIACFVIIPCTYNLPNTLLTSITPTTTVYPPLLSPQPLHRTNNIWCRVQTHDKWVSGSL